jgi:hypothetical protein
MIPLNQLISGKIAFDIITKNPVARVLMEIDWKLTLICIP